MLLKPELYHYNFLSHQQNQELDLLQRYHSHFPEEYKQGSYY